MPIGPGLNVATICLSSMAEVEAVSMFTSFDPMTKIDLSGCTRGKSFLPVPKPLLALQTKSWNGDNPYLFTTDILYYP